MNDEAWPGHDAERDEIADTPATSPAGWCAKALALSTWQISPRGELMMDDHTGLTASLLDDMAGPARAAILADLERRFGPLPARENYDGWRPDWSATTMAEAMDRTRKRTPAVA